MKNRAQENDYKYVLGCVRKQKEINTKLPKYTHLQLIHRNDSMEVMILVVNFIDVNFKL